MKKTIILTISLLIGYNSFCQDFIIRKGNKLTKGKNGPEVYLRGICFGNQVWNDVELPYGHHNEMDFRRVKALGMNAIRFYMNYKTFESDAAPFTYKNSGWDWIDQNIAWAKKYNLYLILNIHIPQGGFQSLCKGDALWSVPSNQDRLAALWKAIARRYQNETQIAGYDLLNEPTPSVSVSLWKNLAQRIIDSIRTVDKQHLVIAERAIALGCNYGFNDGNYNFQPLQEENLMYTVHMYDPFEFTHQYQGFVGTGEGGKYPDENAISAPSDVSWAYGQYNNPSVPMGTSNWTYYQGVPFQVNNDSAIIARPVFYGHRLKNGVAYFDDIVIHEVDAQGNILREIAKLNFTNNTNIWFWSEKNDGTLGTSTDGHNDNFSLTVTGTSGYSSVTIQPLQFKVEKGKWYAASAWMKGENLPTGITVNTTMEFYYSPSKQKVKARNATTLREMILAATRFPRERNFPVYYGEFGAGRPCFVNDKGGDRWTKDVIYIFDSLDFHFTYHAYREDNFGYYGGWEGPLDTSTVQQSLKKVFEEYFIQSPTGAEMQNITEEIGIAVYPNPASHLICFENRNQKMANVQISDTKGKVLKTITLAGNETTELEIKDLTRGMYFCLLHQDGQKRTFKLVKE